MKVFALILTFISAGSGLWAAYKWLLASRVNVVPHEERNGQLVRIPTSDAPVWINALRATLQESGEMNKVAAKWTAVSVAFAAFAALAGMWT